jgi:hypothetical protein
VVDEHFLDLWGPMVGIIRDLHLSDPSCVNWMSILEDWCMYNANPRESILMILQSIAESTVDDVHLHGWLICLLSIGEFLISNEYWSS